MNFKSLNIAITLSLLVPHVYADQPRHVSETQNGITVTAYIVPTKEFAKTFGTELPSFFNDDYNRVFPVALTIENNTDTDATFIVGSFCDEKNVIHALNIGWYQALYSIIEHSTESDPKSMWCPEEVIKDYRALKPVIQEFSHVSGIVKPNQSLKTYVFLLSEPNFDHPSFKQQSLISELIFGPPFSHPAYFPLRMYFEKANFELQVPN